MKRILILLLFLTTILKTEAQTSVFDIANGFLNEGNYNEAIEVLNKVNPKTEKIYAKLGSIYHSIGNYTKAIDTYEKALLDTTNTSIRYKLGQSYVAAGFSNKALEAFEQVLKADSTFLMAATSLGKMYVARNRLENAVEIYSFLKLKDGLNPEYPYKLAQVYEKQKKYFDMGNNYLESYEIDSLHLRSIYGLAKFYKKLKFKDSTALFLNKGLEIDSLNTKFLQFKANELYYSKDFEKCLSYLNTLDSLNYKTINSLEMTGMCYYNLEQLDLAETAFKKALKLDFYNSQILYRLSSLYYDKKDFKKANMYLNLSINAGLGDLDKQYFLKGILAKESGDLKNALSHFNESYRYNTKNYKALFEVATISDEYFKDKKIALKEYDTFLKRFKSKDAAMTTFAENRILEIKKELFLKGEPVEN